MDPDLVENTRKKFAWNKYVDSTQWAPVIGRLEVTRMHEFVDI